MAREKGLMLVDTPEILDGLKTVWTPDMVHLSPSANQRIADALAKVVECGDTAPSPARS